MFRSISRARCLLRPRSICACSVWPHATSAARTLEVWVIVRFRTLRYTQSRTMLTFCSFLESSGHERQTTVENSVCDVLPCRRMDRRMFRSMLRARCLFRPRSVCACSVWPHATSAARTLKVGYALTGVRSRCGRRARPQRQGVLAAPPDPQVRTVVRGRGVSVF